MYTRVGSWVNNVHYVADLKNMVVSNLMGSTPVKYACQQTRPITSLGTGSSLDATDMKTDGKRTVRAQGKVHMTGSCQA